MEACKTAYRCRCGREIEDVKPGETVTCPGCGIKFAIEDGCAKFKILPEMSEDEFVRAAWIHLTKADVPLDVFKCNLSAVETVEHCVAVDKQKTNVSFKAFDSFLSDKFVQSECMVESVACIESGRKDVAGFVDYDEGASLDGSDYGFDPVRFNGDMFLESLDSVKIDSFATPDAGECEKMKITQVCRWEADRKHDDDIEETSKIFLGDVEYSYEEHSVDIVERYTQIFIVPEYRATITYNGRTYSLAAYPFGDAEVYGGEMENDTGARAFVDERRKTLVTEAERMRESSAAEKRRGSRPLTIAVGAIWCVLTLGAIVFTMVLVIENFYYGSRYDFIPTGAWIACLTVLSALLVAAIAVTVVGRFWAGRLAIVDSIVDGVKLGEIGNEKSGARDSMRIEDARHTVNALNVAALVLWGAIVLAVLAFTAIFGCCALFWCSRMSDVGILISLIVGGVIFAGAVAVSVVNAVAACKNGKRIDSRVDELIQSKEENMQSEAEAFAENYRGELLDALNAKLASLGMDPAGTADLEQSVFLLPAALAVRHIL